MERPPAANVFDPMPFLINGLLGSVNGDAGSCPFRSLPRASPDFSAGWKRDISDLPGNVMPRLDSSHSPPEAATST